MTAPQTRAGRDGKNPGVGENGRTARLREDDVRRLRVRLQDVAEGRSSIRAVAGEFGVSESQVRRIRDGRAWAHVR